jgi:hypothetical protein
MTLKSKYSPQYLVLQNGSTSSLYYMYNVLLIVADTMTSQNTEFSSWNILCMKCSILQKYYCLR